MANLSATSSNVQVRISSGGYTFSCIGDIVYSVPLKSSSSDEETAKRITNKCKEIIQEKGFLQGALLIRNLVRQHENDLEPILKALENLSSDQMDKKINREKERPFNLIINPKRN